MMESNQQARAVLKASYATAPLALKLTYGLALVAVAVGVWLSAERAALPQWAQLMLPALAVVAARSAMRSAYALHMAAQYRKQLASCAQRLGPSSRGANH